MLTDNFKKLCYSEGFTTSDLTVLTKDWQIEVQSLKRLESIGTCIYSEELSDLIDGYALTTTQLYIHADLYQSAPCKNKNIFSENEEFFVKCLMIDFENIKDYKLSEVIQEISRDIEFDVLFNVLKGGNTLRTALIDAISNYYGLKNVFDELVGIFEKINKEEQQEVFEAEESRDALSYQELKGSHYVQYA